MTQDKFVQARRKKEAYRGTSTDREMNLLGHQLENMPRCKAIFERYTESYPENWARKIIWAYRKLEEEGKSFFWTDIRKIAG